MENHVTSDSSFYKEMIFKMNTMKGKMDKLLSGKSPNFNNWLSSERVCKVLYISNRTLQNYRDSGILPYSKVGGKIYLNMNDIDEVMRKNYVPKK